MQIEKSIDLPASPQKVWNALTDPNVTKRYFFTPHENITELSIVHGDFHDQKEFEQNKNSWDLILNGLKTIVGEQ